MFDRRRALALVAMAAANAKRITACDSCLPGCPSPDPLKGWQKLNMSQFEGIELVLHERTLRISLDDLCDGLLSAPSRSGKTTVMVRMHISKTPPRKGR